MRSQLRIVAWCSAALFTPLLFPLCIGRVFTKDDLAALHLPFRFLYQQALRSGDSFLWTPAVQSGFYLHGEGEAGLTHPLHYVLYRLLPLGVAFNLEIAITYIAMLAGTGLLLRRLGLSREAAWFGAMVFTFSGFNLFNLMHVNHIAAVAHVPWLLLFACVLLTSASRFGRAWAFAGLAIATGSQFLVGNPQYIWLTLVALAFTTMCGIYSTRAVGRVPLLLMALATGAALGAVQLLPTLDFAMTSTRAGWSLNDRLSFSLAPLNLVQLWSPFAFRFRVVAPPAEEQIVHEFIVYNGAFCTVALAWLAVRWREQSRRRLIVALLAFAALALVLALGRYGLVYVWLARWPGLNVFRAPARHLVLFQLSLSVIAAIVLEDLIAVVWRGETIDARRLWPLAIPAVLSLATTAFGAALANSAWAAARGLPFSGLLRAAPWAGLVVATTVLVAMAGRGVRWAIPVLIVAAAFDLGLWGYSYAYRWGPLQTVEALAASASVPQGAERGDLIAPMTGGGPVNLPLLRGMRLIDGYVGLVPASVLDPNDPVTQRIAGVRWRPNGTAWVPVAGSMPRARLVSLIEHSGRIKADVRTIDLSQIALVDRPVGPLRGRPGTARIIDDRPGSIVVQTMAEGSQLLVMTERFHTGWRAAQDGVERPTIRVYGDYLGSVVDRGGHRVTFTFAPDSARVGLRASLAAVAFTIIASVVLGVNGRRGAGTIGASPERKRRVGFAAAAVVLAVTVPSAALVAIDVYLHRKYEKTAGFNVWGYRGPVAGRKLPGEYRVVVLGGSAAFGYGTNWDNAIPAVLERDLAGRAVGPYRSFRVINLGYNNEGAYSFTFTLDDYRWLQYDLAILYEGYNDLMGDPAGPNLSVFRHDSPVFRLTGYLPIFPMIFREKAAALAGGSSRAHYASEPRTRFTPGVATRTTAEVLRTAADVTQSLGQQLDRVTAEPPRQIVDAASTGCRYPWQEYCRSIGVAIDFAVDHNAQVLIATQPFGIGDTYRTRHQDQQREMASMVARRYGENPLVRYVNLGAAVDLSDPALSFDAMHLTAAGNKQAAAAFVGPVLDMAARRAGERR